LSVKIWADERVTPTLEGVAQRRGYEATSNRSRGMLNARDSELFSVVVREDWVFVTNNETDFVNLARQAELHPGLVSIPQSAVVRRRRTFDAVIRYIEDQATTSDESAADWMVCRLVVADEHAAIRHAWLPEPAE
jgi:predicted nuclease of predicted toxin-antitoxin system